MNRWRIVAWCVAGRSRGSSPSKPSSTGRSANAGMTSATGWSSSSSPRSIIPSAATLTIAFVIDAIQNIVSARTGSSPSTLNRPNAPS